MSEPQEVHVAKPGRYVVQSFVGNGYRNDQFFDNLKDAIDQANDNANLFGRAYRVLDTQPEETPEETNEADS